MDDELFEQAEKLLEDSAAVFGTGGNENWLKDKPRVKNAGEVEPTLNLPFTDYPLLEDSTQYWETQENINSINLAGKATGGFIRAAISLTKLDTVR